MNSKLQSITSKCTLQRDSEVLIIGAGVGGLCAAVQLQTQLGCNSSHIYDSNRAVGGVWAVQKYPGVACDVPADFYSFSFFLGNWTAFRPSGDELQAYFHNLAVKYDLYSHITFQSVAEEARWDASAAHWVVKVRIQAEDARRNVAEVAGVWIEHHARLKNFKGKIVQSAAWDPSLDLRGKNVAVFGNGPTGTQIVPAIMPYVASVAHVSRSVPCQHPPAMNFPYNPVVDSGASHGGSISRRKHEGGKKGRTKRKMQAVAHIHKTAPTKYHKILIPEFELGCKVCASGLPVIGTDLVNIKYAALGMGRGVFESLNDLKTTLITSEDVQVHPYTISHENSTYPVDVIILATGYTPTHGVGHLRVIGRDDKTLTQHWEEEGGVSAYGTIAMHGFPNLFLIKGPNTASTNTSAILIAENVVNLAIKVMKPVLRKKAVHVEVKACAEKEYARLVQAASLKKVWYTGCSSWYFSSAGDRRNIVLYPFSQIYCWWSSAFPHWDHWEYRSRHARR